MESNASLLDQYMPLLKGLQKVVKEQSSIQKEELFRMQREIKAMQDAKRQLLEGVFKCEAKILAIEGCFGMNTP